MKHHYSNDISNNKIVILGPVPPPLGGVSVHIERVQKKLKKQGNQVVIFDTTTEFRYKSMLRYMYRLSSFIRKHKPNIVYFHTPYLKKSIYEMLVLSWLSKRFDFKLVLIEHDCRHMYKRFRLFKWLFSKCLQKVHQLILIGNRTEQSYQDNVSVVPKNTFVEAAFIPPDVTKEAKLLELYPGELFYFIEQHKPVIGINAFQSVLLNTGDLYGLDKSIELITHLKSIYPKVGLVLVLGQTGDEDYFEVLQKRIDAHGIRENVFILGGQQELWPLFKLFDLFIRPTLSDGESVSVQEALYFGTPVVASNVCVRPKTVMLFKTGNQQDFNKQVERVLHAKTNQHSNSVHQKQIG